jgi:cellulose synthase/poly-beta-1,6-N-acetylglucosamine synthase-like glycosyltransferase
MLMPAWLAVPVLALTAGVLAALMGFALHRTHLLLLSRRPLPPTPVGWKGELPGVTVQLPVFNEAGVVERLLEAVGELRYPRDRLQVQLLDDSTDGTSAIAERTIERLRAGGLRIDHLRRRDRTGFKAGALQAGMECAEGEYILVLDADFVPGPGLIHELLPPFLDPSVGMVQARWDHLNEEEGLLTRCQALLLDAHFFFEQGGRCASGAFMSFNGTAGMWRRTALEEAGGWSWDTLTEDLDVSYRAQMAGWRFVFLPGVGVPAELPGSVRALEVQQKRWSQGGIQTAGKVLPALWSGPWSLRVKLEGAVHLLAHLAHPLTLVLGVLLLPSAVARRSLGLDRLLILDLVVFAVATLSFLAFYLAAGRRRGRPWRRVIPHGAATLALGVGLTSSVSRAVARGLRPGSSDPFERTPKRGWGESIYRSVSGRGDRLLKAVLLGWLLLCTIGALAWGYPGSLPFLILFMSGYAWLLIGDIAEEGFPVAAPGPIRASESDPRSAGRPRTGEPRGSRLTPTAAQRGPGTVG